MFENIFFCRTPALHVVITRKLFILRSGGFPHLHQLVNSNSA